MRNIKKAASEVFHEGMASMSLSTSSNNEQEETSSTAATATAIAPSTQHLTIVIKLGSSSIVNEDDFQPQLALLSSIVETVCSLKRKGHRVILVSSGAIAMGLKRMEMRNKPKILAEKQALAAIGQGRLIALWDNLFSMLGEPIAQVLLTRSDISDRSRYLNSTKTLSALLNYGVIPIVNENDTVSVSEIKFGDNDTLSAITASMVNADYLFLLTDVDCLYTDNPRRFPETARAVRIVRDIESMREMVSTSTMGSNLGTGGMETKIIAAELATNAGVATVITHGKKPQNILEIVNAHHVPSISINDQEGTEPVPTERSKTDEEYEKNTPLHTIFLPEPNPLPDKRWWVVHGLKARGRIIIDEGAYRAIARSALRGSPAVSTKTTRNVSPTATPSIAAQTASSPLSPLSETPPPPSSSQQEPESAVPSPSLLAGASARPLGAPIPRSSSSSAHHARPNSGNGGRLLPAGVIAVEGTFAAGQAVTVVVERRRRRNRSDSINNTQELSARARRKVRQYSRGANSGLSSLANSLILEQANKIGDPYSGSNNGTPDHSRSNSPSRGGNAWKRNASSGYDTRSDTDHEAVDTTDDDESEEVLERIEFGQGLANYNYQDIDRIKGHQSSEIEKILGYIESEHCVESITSLKRLEL